ncbi:MAG: acylphosphatase [Capsulimonadaceae bacterium]|nr:acylphosphatase [Capsulimonadaceae bacterium]
MATKRVEAIVSGRVQGVGFRYFAAHVADRLGVVGTVRNTHDGQIEAVVEGDEEALGRFLAELRKGPAKAEVTGLHTSWSDAGGEFSKFEAIS